MSELAPTSSVKRIYIPGPPSLASRIFWYFAKYLLPFLIGKIPTPVKGQQIWKLPPPRLAKAIKKGDLLLDEWVEEKSGWKIPVLQMARKAGEAGPTRAILYLHGGGFMIAPSPAHWTWIRYLAEELDAVVYVVPYPLAPTNTIQEWLPKLVSLYASFLQKSTTQELIIAGDSSGAVLSLCLANAASLSTPPLPLPRHIIALSPVANLDLYELDAEMRAILPNDPFMKIENLRLSRRLWLGLPPSPSPDVPLPSSYLSNPRYNPSKGNLTIFAEARTQLVLASGTYDILHPYVGQYTRQAESAGVRTVYVEAEGQFHCFPLFRGLVWEADEAGRIIVEAVKAYQG